MNTSGGKSIPRWLSILLSVLVLAVCLFYTCAAVCLAPYPGLDLENNWVVAAVEPCAADLAWCEANQDTLQPGDQVLIIGNLTFDEFKGDLGRVPFGGYDAGDSVSITFVRDEQESSVNWRMLGPTAVVRSRRIIASLFLAAPFWLTGTLVLFLVHPGDRVGFSHWLLFVLLTYVTAMWLTAGAYNFLRVAYVALVEHVLVWFMVPIYLHFHLVAPRSLIPRWERYALWPLYVAASVMAALELFRVAPLAAYGLATLLTFLGSLGILVFRLLARPHAAERRMAVLMLVGICLSLGPGIAAWSIPTVLQTPVPGGLSAIIAMFAIPLLSFFYAYATFKRYLGHLEARLRYGLSLYSFLLLYATIVFSILYLGSYWFGTSEGWAIFALASWTVFAAAVVPLYMQFQKLFGRLVYGKVYEPLDILSTFATRIQALLGSKDWTRALTDELAASLLIRQSALYLLADGEPELVYVHGVGPDEELAARQSVQQLLADAGRYRPVSDGSEDRSDWVRLVVPLCIRAQTVGVWLFGQRDPDSYYSERDIKLLNTLAAQVAVAVENERLYSRALHEIAEREQVEEALRESEEKLQAVLNATTESVILTDEQGSVLALNQTAAQRFGIDADEMIGLRGLELVSRGAIPLDLFESRMALISQVFISGKPVQFEDERDGAIFATSAYPIFDADGKVRRAAVFARDVTAHRQAEQRAIQAERLAAMGQIAAALAHEINNPLQTIRSSLEMLVDFDLASDESRERLDIALKEIGLLARVTRGVLGFTQSAEESPCRVSAIQLAQKAIALAGKQLELAHVQVMTSFPDQSAFVFAAPNQIVHVLLNLITNVVEAMPGGGKLDIAVCADGGMVDFSLAGDRPHFTPEQVEHLFDPFYDTGPRNRGLGLWVNRSIVERHSGTISAQNVEGQLGVIFRVALPLDSS